MNFYEYKSIINLINLIILNNKNKERYIRRKRRRDKESIYKIFIKCNFIKIYYVLYYSCNNLFTC